MRISIVTAVLNAESLLERTIKSVLRQEDSDLEYIIIDGGSNDKTTEIIKRYESRLAYWSSGDDQGLYDALNKGFQKATGDVMAWLNAGDTYFPWTFANVRDAFSKQAVAWVTGRASGRYDGSDATQLWGRKYYPRALIRAGFCHGEGFGFIPQEATFWTRGLWEQAGSRVDASLQLAGDHELWTRFAKYSKLYVLDIPLATFCVHEGQLSHLRREEYYGEVYAQHGWAFKSLSHILRSCRASTILSGLHYTSKISKFA